MARFVRTTNDSFFLYHGNAECERGPGADPQRCSNMIDQERRGEVCFTCWFQYFHQGARLGPKATIALYHHWKAGGDW